MKIFIVLFCLFNIVMLPQQLVTITGKITNRENSEAVSDANVIVKGKGTGTASDGQGRFFIKMTYADTLVVSHIGYKTVEYTLPSYPSGMPPKRELEALITLTPEIIPAQTVLIEGSVGKDYTTPLTYSQLKQEDIVQKYIAQDIPQLLSTMPSTMFYSENGNGIGYNYLSIRGFDQRRISVSINGIPQNEPEDHNIYWLDFPDILANTEFIQVQRGAGAGIFGYPSIGGSINLLTSNLAGRKSAAASVSYGSYNTKKYSAEFSSGLINSKYAFYGKLSKIQSDGYRDNSWTNFNSYYFSLARYDERLTTQINFYGGPVEDALAYTGLPKFAVKDKELRKKNYSYWEAAADTFVYVTPRKNNEVENFSQPHYEMLNEYRLTESLTLNSSLFYIEGNGFFDYDGSWADAAYFRLNGTQNPVNALIRAEVNNNQYGWIPRISFKHTNGTLIAGGEFRIHRSTHWGAIEYAENIPAGVEDGYHYYEYNGAKDIINGFVNETYNFNEQLSAVGEIQVAYNKYRLYNEKYVGTDFSVSNTFFNPRIGVNYKLNTLSNIYLSFARVSREPRLKDYYDAAESSGGTLPQFTTNADGTYNYDDPFVKPETMNDFELGASLGTDYMNLSLNLFYMLFDNEIVKNGQIDRFGQPMTGNAKRTIHRGVEASALFKLPYGFEIFGNATYSKNFIDEGTTYFDNPDGSGTTVALDLSGNRISGFPEFLANAGVSFKYEGLFLQFTGKYVGKFYSDNYDNKLTQYLEAYPGFVSYTDNKNDSYFTTDFAASYEINLFNSFSNNKIIFLINNVFDKLYSANAIGGEFFPAAERNFMVSLQIGL